MVRRPNTTAAPELPAQPSPRWSRRLAQVFLKGQPDQKLGSIHSLFLQLGTVPEDFILSCKALIFSIFSPQPRGLHTFLFDHFGRARCRKSSLASFFLVTPNSFSSLVSSFSRAFGLTVKIQDSCMHTKPLPSRRRLGRYPRSFALPRRRQLQVGKAAESQMVPACSSSNCFSPSHPPDKGPRPWSPAGCSSLPGCF